MTTSAHPSRRHVLAAGAAGTATTALGLTGASQQTARAADLPLLGTYDVVVVGSGAAGMTAALTAAAQGLSCVVLEKAPTFGGSAARSGAGIWIPNNSVLLAAGVPDTPAKAAAYLSAVYKWLALAAVNAKGAAVATQCLARGTAAALRGEKPLTMGQSLAAGLRLGLRSAGVPVWLGTPLSDLHVEDGAVTGAVVTRDGGPGLVRARRGVIVGSGGFEHNAAMRAQYQRQPIGTDWTVGAKENTGDGIRAGHRLGAALGLMDDAWWGPAIPVPGQPYFCLAERTLPGGLLVNAAGARFVNEAAPYSDVVHTMYDVHDTSPAIPSWLIVDQHYRNRYLFKDVLPTLPFPAAWYDSGAAHKAWTLDALAASIGVPATALRTTVDRFNSQALKGKDPDFHRGDSAYDHYYTDPSVLPNSCLAPLWLPPYHAFRIVPGDLGTKGGLLTDARARVLREDGSVIRGLYAAGNASAAVMGHSYAGAGSTIGPAMTFGYVAAKDIAGTL
ncbi:FAD-dependent oxidoreductase [Streptomyces sp. JL3001]|uniref:FAD-dependent oxidoreductase n=1 Tax=Streptomyces sp. JL3001 TaxID=3400923 RepID=UPI003B28B6F4